MESRQIVWFVPECSDEELARMDFWTQTDEERERKKGADNATGRLDNVDWRSVIMPGLSDYADCRCMSELSLAPPATIGQLRETTRSNATAHVIYTSRTNKFPVNCLARRTHRVIDTSHLIVTTWLLDRTSVTLSQMLIDRTSVISVLNFAWLYIGFFVRNFEWPYTICACAL